MLFISTMLCKAGAVSFPRKWKGASINPAGNIYIYIYKDISAILDSKVKSFQFISNPSPISGFLVASLSKAPFIFMFCFESHVHIPNFVYSARRLNALCVDVSVRCLRTVRIVSQSALTTACACAISSSRHGSLVRVARFST